MNCRIVMPLALFLLPEASRLYTPEATAVTKQQVVGFSANKNGAMPISNLIAGKLVAEVTTSPKLAIAQCSPDQFPIFFDQFVRDPAGRYEYIGADMGAEVQVRDYQDPRRLLMVVGDKSYGDFRIGAIGNKYVYLDPFVKYRGDDELLKTRLKVDYQRIDAKTFRVNYIRAEFINDRKDKDGNLHGNLIRTYGNPEAYIFEHHNGCWHLTQSLRQYKSWKESNTNQLFINLIQGYRNRVVGHGNRSVFMGQDDATRSHERIVTAYTDLLYYKKLDSQFGYAESDKRDRWREWNILREAVSTELTRFYSTLQCSSKRLAVVPRFDDYDDSLGIYSSQSLDRIATAISEYHGLQSDLHLSPEAVKQRWLEVRKKISINTNDACSILGN